jgi:cholesterol transport system auxiliary component
MTLTPNVRTLAVGLTALLLSGCVNIGTKPKTPPNLLTLIPATARAAAAEQTPKLEQTVSMTLPIVPQMLSVNRIPVTGATGRITYIGDANWVEPPAALFRALVGEVVSAKMGRVVVDPRTLPVVAGTRLSGQLVAFGIDESTSQAVVTYDALLARKGVASVAARRFSARVAVAPINGPNAGAALNDAANQVAAQIADWVGRAE